MSEFTINVSGLDAVRKRFKSVNDFFNSKAPVQSIVSEIKEGILTKTAQGHDYMGRNFKPYSKAYAKKKGSSRVDLRGTGEMMDSVDTEVTDPRHGRVFIRGARALIAQFHNKGGPRAGRPPMREFFNISKSALQKLWTKYRDDVLMRLLGRR
jgi:hypothetical protein